MLVEFDYHGRQVKLYLHPETVPGKPYPHDGLSRNIFLDRTFYDLKGLESTVPFLRKNSIVCDCGAMIGNHTVFWAPHVECVYSFEPFPESFALLRKNVAANQLSNVVVSDYVLSDEQSDHWSAFSPSKHKGPMQFRKDANGKHKSARLDDLVGEDSIDLLKIDVEGAERSVLLGATRLLASKPVVLLEMHYLKDHPEYIGCMEILASHGYQRGLDLFVDDKWTEKHQK